MILDFPSTTLSRRLARKYQYDEFIVRRWIGIFGEGEAVELIKAMEEGVPKYIRINTIKTREKGIEERDVVERLENRGFSLSKTEIPYCYEVVEEPYSIGATPEYLIGYYYVMDKSSCVPPLALAEDCRDVVADFAASPGGKATMLAQLVKAVIALEAQKERIQALVDNVHRMGAYNTAILHMDARDFPGVCKVDGVLLDAPCSGEGIIHKDESRKRSRGAEDIEFCSKLQRELLEAAVKSVKEGGVIVYSTCSLTPEENEFVIQWALENLPVKLEKIGLPGEEGLTEVAGIKLDESLRLARRYYPHKNRCSGFFVAKMRVLE